MVQRAITMIEIKGYKTLKIIVAALIGVVCISAIQIGFLLRDQTALSRKIQKLEHQVEAFDIERHIQERLSYPRSGAMFGWEKELSQ